MDIETQVQAAARATGVPFEVLACDPSLADTAAFCAHYDIPLEQSANAILVKSKRPKGVFARCLALATTRLDVNHTVREQMGVKRLSFASADDTREMTGMLIGGVTPFALPEGLPILIDAAVMRCEWVIVGGGSRSTKLKLSPEALAALPGAEIVEGLAS